MNEILWIESWPNPPRVRAEPSGMVRGPAHSNDRCDVDVHSGVPGRVFTRMAALNQTQLIESGTPIAKTSFKSPREGFNRNSSGTFEDVRTLCNAGQLKEALHILNQHHIRADSYTYVSLLQECIKMKGLAEGKQVHAHIIHTGFKPNIFLLNTLVNMYAKCGCVLEARKVFDRMPERVLFTWNIMIAGYAKHGCDREAFKIYEQMQGEGVTPDRITFICILNACASLGALEKGKQVHADIIKAGVSSYVNLENTLLNMYAKCGSLKDARQVFDNMVQRSVVSWSAMIAGYAQNRCGREALQIYEQMIWAGVTPDSITFLCVLDACSSLGALQKGKEVHADIIKAGTVSYIKLENTLVNMYAKCGSMKDARQVFDNMAQQNVVSWNTLITGYTQHGYSAKVFENYEQMIREGVTPNKVTFICVLNACASLAALEMGKLIHADISKSGVVPDVMLGNTLVDMYAKCGSVCDARKAFDNMSKRNVVSWNAMIAGYAQHGCGKEALELFEQLHQEGLKPNAVTFICLLSACSRVGLLDEGRHYFDIMSRDHGLTPTVEHFGCMVDLFGHVGQLEEAEDFINKMSIQPDVGIWGALLAACRVHGNVDVAERAAKCLLKLDPDNACATVGHICCGWKMG